MKKVLTHTPLGKDDPIVDDKGNSSISLNENMTKVMDRLKIEKN